MMRRFAESMLANVIAFEEAGVPRHELQQSVGRDGGMVVGRGVIYQTPVGEYLSEEDGELLFNAYSELISEYNNGQLDKKRMNDVKMRNDVASKVGNIRQILKGKP